MSFTYKNTQYYAAHNHYTKVLALIMNFHMQLGFFMFLQIKILDIIVDIKTLTTKRGVN